MNIKLTLPDYDGNAIDVIWDDDSLIDINYKEGTVIIRGNHNGLMSLAKQMIYLAINNVAQGSHIHYDDFLLHNAPIELIVEKMID